LKVIVETIRSQKYNGHDTRESGDFVDFLGLAGLGKAEAAARRQSDIDWQRETITTFRHKTKSGFAIPIYPQLKALLIRRRRDDAPNERVFKIRFRGNSAPTPPLPARHHLEHGSRGPSSRKPQIS
jgi:integrase